MRHRRQLLFLALSLLARAAAAQESADQAVLVARLGDDTVTVERIQYAAGRIRAEVVLRVPRTTLRVYDVALDPTGRPAIPGPER